MKKTSFLSVVLLGMFSALCSLQAQVSGIERPNVIIFYVDDLGWQDVEKLNDLWDPCPYETPNLIRLAERGMNFSQGYSPAPTCAPSRAAIITGQHPAQLGFTHVTAASIPAPSKSVEWHEPFLGAHLELEHLTLADALNRNGYRTGHFGKWHAGLNATAFGFDEVNQTRGVHRGMGDRTKDFATAKDKTYPLSKEKYPPVSEKFPEGISYPKDELTEEAMSFISRNKDEPFFLNLCHWLVHWPMLTRNGQLLEYYCDKLGQPFPPKKGPMTREGQQNPYFASMVTTVDWSLGRILDLLENTDDPRHPGKKLIETTYLFFTSDNGGAEIKGKEILSDNFPLKAGKKHTDEGGIRVPMVVTGPGVPAGTEKSTMINQLDFFPTILHLTSTEIEKKEAAKLSGLDMSEVLTADADEVMTAGGTARESMFWHFPHNQMNATIRKGDFKFYRHFRTETHSLYRLYENGKAADIEEKHDLAANPEYGEIVKELAAELNGNLEATNAVFPHLNPHYSDAKLPSAKIGKVSFDGEKGRARARLDPKFPKASSASILYYSGNGDSGGHSMRDVDYSKADPKVDYQMKRPAEISEDGFLITASVPAEVGEIRFLIVDENNFQHFTPLVKAKADAEQLNAG